MPTEPRCWQGGAQPSARHQALASASKHPVCAAPPFRAAASARVRAARAPLAAPLKHGAALRSCRVCVSSRDLRLYSQQAERGACIDARLVADADLPMARM